MPDFTRGGNLFQAHNKYFSYFQSMKKLLLIAALAVAATNSYAQDCSSIVSSSGKVKTQLQKASSESPGNVVTATLWLSRDADGYYLHISPVVVKDNKPLNIKGMAGERIQLTYTDGNALSSGLIKKQGNEVIVTLGNEMMDALAIMRLENIAWFENNAMQPSLQLLTNDIASQKLMQASTCLK